MILSENRRTLFRIMLWSAIWEAGRSRPIYLDRRTISATARTSQQGHFRTHAGQQTAAVLNKPERTEQLLLLSNQSSKARTGSRIQSSLIHSASGLTSGGSA
jgi:hypothetical protein